MIRAKFKSQNNKRFIIQISEVLSSFDWFKALKSVPCKKLSI
jgi:hypothetical protein